MTYPSTALLIEQIEPNAQGKGVIQIHAMGCRHQSLFKNADLLVASDPDEEWPVPRVTHPGEASPTRKGVAGAVEYFLGLRSGLLDDGEDNGYWVERLAPCAKAQIKEEAATR